ncbi:MAG TPA: efflux RND transporter periplasmic adaptor subunit [Opitutaceae bacterium]|nr:efflux RND transporter periplasmic adaptor subunit [Opitutaceae bacterium]
MLKAFVRFILFVAVIAVFVMGPLFLVKKSQFGAMGAAAANMVLPPTVVTATPAKADSWENTLSATGSFVAVQGVTVGAEVPGKVVKIGFEPGATANAGDVLIQLDTSIEEAQLQSAEANAALAKANLERTRELRQNNTNSPAELDAAEAQSKQAKAQTDNARALIEKKTIRAPFTGRLGLRLVNLGQILKDGEPITTLQTLDPIYVNFSVPQQRLSQLSPGNDVRVTSDASPGHIFEGKITAISPEVDAATRNIRVQATLANKEEKLRGGMFANVDIVLPSHTKVLMIPVTSVLYAPYGDSVFVVDEKKSADGKVEKVLRQQFVRLAGSRGDFVNVVDGLKPGETVVTSGVFKLRPGMAVTIDNKLAPNAQLAPKPKDA